MAHGFASYQDNRGPSGIEKFLEKKFDEQFDKQTTRLGNFIRDKVTQGITDALFNIRTKGPRTPQPYSWKKDDVPPIQNMLSGGGQRALTGSSSSAINPEVIDRGGEPVKARNPFVNFSGNNLSPETDAANAIFDTTAQRVVDDDDSVFTKSTAITGGGGSGEIVQAIERLTGVTMGLGAAIQAQTRAQQTIANEQQLQAEKLARKSLAAAEEASLEQGGDFSSNIAYEALGAGGMGLMNRGSRRGGGAGAGLGGKAAAASLGRAVMRRGGARAGKRLGIAVGGKLLAGMGKKAGAKLGAKAIGKVAGGALAKSLGKKIPLVGLGLGAVFAAQRALQGDFIGAGLELASGAASTVPGVGTAASVGIDAALAGKDMMMPSGADGMLTTGPESGYLAELHGTEVTLSGNKSKEMKAISLNIGEGILDAQRRNKRQFGKIQAEGLKEFYDRGNGWDGFFGGLKEILGAFKFPGGYRPFGDFSEDSDNRNNNNNNETDVSNRKVVSINRDNYDFGHNLPPTGTGDADLAAAQQYGASRNFGLRKHAGQDFDISGPDATFDSQIGGKVIGVYHQWGGGYGRYVDIYNEDLDVTERIAEGAEILVKEGDMVEPGTPVARGETRTGVIHYEIRKGRSGSGGDFAGTLDPVAFLKEHVAHTNGVPTNKTNKTNITPNQVIPLKDGLTLEQLSESELSGEDKTEQLEKLKKMLGLDGEDGDLYSSTLGRKYRGLKALALAQNRSIDKLSQRVQVPGVGSIGYYNKFGIKKYTFFDENNNEIKRQEFDELLRSEQNEVKKAEELLNRRSDASGADALNTSSSEVSLNDVSGKSQVVVISSSDTGSTKQKSSQGVDVGLGSTAAEAGVSWYQAIQLARC